MTTIAYDGRTLAADKQATCGNSVCTVTKIQRIGDVLYGYSGDLNAAQMIMEWLKNPGDPSTFPSFDEDGGATIIMIKDRNVFQYNGSHLPVKFEDQYVAIGSGASFALGAMAAGKSAKQAVEIASRLDPYTGMGVDVLKP